MVTCTGGGTGASLATSGSTCWTFGCSSPSRRLSRPLSSAAGWCTLRSAKPSRGLTGTASSPTSRATCTARLTGTRGRTRMRRTTMTLDPTGATRILPTWTLATAMRTAAIVGRRTSSDRVDRCLRRDFFPLWSARDAAFAGSWWSTGVLCIWFVTGLVGWYESVIGVQGEDRAVARNSFFLSESFLTRRRVRYWRRQRRVVQRSGGEGRVPRHSCELVGSFPNMAPLQASQRLVRMADRPAMCVLMAGVAAGTPGWAGVIQRRVQRL